MKIRIKTAILGLVMLVYPSFAQDVVQPKLQYEITVAKKLIQVYVLDKHGEAVFDLTAADFDLYDDGRLQAITDFEKHELAAAKASPAPVPSVRPEPASSLSRRFFFFFDFTFNTSAGIAKSRRAALDFLENQVRPEDKVGILSFAMRKGLTLHEYLTADHLRIRNVIEGFAAGRFKGRAARFQGGPEEDIPQDPGAVRPSERILNAENDLVERTAFDFASQMTELAKALRGIPGIKNIIFFSSGIPNPMLYGSEDVQVTQPRRGMISLRDLFDEMCKGLAASSCAVYAVNVSGRGSMTFGKSDVSFQVGGDISDARGTDFVRADRLGDGALKQLAEVSGGKYFDNINRYEKANKMIQKTTGTFYVLGYAVEEKLDGRFHDLRIVVKRKGCSVFGQKGYFNPKPFSDYSENEKLLHIMDLVLADTPLLRAAAEVPLTVLPIVDKGKPAVVAILDLSSDLASKVLANAAEALGLVSDEKGETNSTVWLTLTKSHPEKVP
ncbi:MAG: VWA domain-containing protein, partial [Candidatus Aminicenantales bacterium]